MSLFEGIFIKNINIIKVTLIFLILSICLPFNMRRVFAEETFYKNKNGVTLTEEEYNFISKMYWDGYQSLMTLEDYEEFQDSKVMDGQVEVKILDYDNSVIPYNSSFPTGGRLLKILDYDNSVIPYSSSFSSGGKSLKIFKSCSSNCLISVTLQWTGNPIVRSYDVIGAYIENTSFTNTPTTIVATSSSRTVITDLKKTNNGIGSSFKLPDGSNITVNQVFRVNTGGHVYASYQHAISTSTLAKSKDYIFSYYGYGRVFQFSDSSKDIYDAMNGVDIEV